MPRGNTLATWQYTGHVAIHRPRGSPPLLCVCVCVCALYSLGAGSVHCVWRTPPCMHTQVIIPTPIVASPSVLIETLVPGLPIGDYISFGARTASAHDAVDGRTPLSVAQRYYIVQRGV